MTTTLYRAADSDDVRVGYSFAACRSAAEAYRDNPGFGGCALYRCRLSLGRVLNLAGDSDQWESLAEAAGVSVDPSRYQYHFARALTADDALCSRLSAAGYDWVRFTDDYPEGCVTYVPLSDDAADAAESAMEQLG